MKKNQVLEKDQSNTKVKIKKDNNDSNSTLPVTIMSMGVRGGVVTILGYENSKGGWKYSWEDNFPSLVNDENKKSSSFQKVITKYNDLDKIFNSLKNKHKTWMIYLPNYIHPDFQQKVWEAVLEESKQIHSYDSKYYDISVWLKDIKKWAKMCFESRK